MHLPTTSTLSGPWDEQHLARFLDEARIPLRLATLAPSGTPCVTSLWYVRRGATLWCATVQSASLVRALSADPRCGFEIAGDRPPYRGARGQGTARLDAGAGEEVLRALIARYLGDDTSELARWLLTRVDREVAIEIVPTRLTTWDYTRRMRGIEWSGER